MDETVYIGQGSIKSRVNSHIESKLNFNKIRFSFVDDKDDRDFWESTLIDQFRKERGRLSYYNKQNGNNFSKLSEVNLSDNINLHAA